MNRTDLSLILSAFSALTILLGVTASVVVVAFLAGILIGSRHSSKSSDEMSEPHLED